MPLVVRFYYLQQTFLPDIMAISAICKLIIILVVDNLLNMCHHFKKSVQLLEKLFYCVTFFETDFVNYNFLEEKVSRYSPFKPSRVY